MNHHILFAFATFHYGSSSYFYLFLHACTCIYMKIFPKPSRHNIKTKYMQNKTLLIQYLITFDESSHLVRFCYFSLRIEFISPCFSSSLLMNIFPKHSRHNIKVKYVQNSPNTIFDHF